MGGRGHGAGVARTDSVRHADQVGLHRSQRQPVGVPVDPVLLCIAVCDPSIKVSLHRLRLPGNPVVLLVFGVRHSAHPGWETQEVPSLSRGIRVRCSQPLLGHCVPIPPAAAAHRSGPLTPRPASKLWYRCGWYPQIYQLSKSVYKLSCANLNLH